MEMERRNISGTGQLGITVSKSELRTVNSQWGIQVQCWKGKDLKSFILQVDGKGKGHQGTWNIKVA